ncbi:hypothetical protein NODU109028_05645 [Nocardioides dubius]|uniref:Uncharacterized protein n=1 Tax=Nocardioides dubius TaxID=317019 RepID=A0ABP4EBL9_9ACTN
MRLYSGHAPLRRTQLIADALVALWVVFWLAMGWSIASSIDDAAQPTRRAEEITSRMASDLTEMKGQVDAIPLLGGSMGSILFTMTQRVEQLSALSADGTASVESMSWKAGLGVALTPNVLMLATYLPRRARFVRRARVQGPLDPEVYALRAITTQPADVLRELVPDPVGGWRAGDRQTIETLAAFQARYEGVG